MDQRGGIDGSKLQVNDATKILLVVGEQMAYLISFL